MYLVCSGFPEENKHSVLGSIMKLLEKCITNHNYEGIICRYYKRAPFGVNGDLDASLWDHRC